MILSIVQLNCKYELNSFIKIEFVFIHLVKHVGLPETKAKNHFNSKMYVKDFEQSNFSKDIVKYCSFNGKHTTHLILKRS